MDCVPTLRLVESPEQVRTAVQRFNDEARRWPYARRMLRSTEYWVLDAETGLFGPSKYVAYLGLDATAYEQAHREGSDGATFDGTVSREAIEQVLREPYGENTDLAERFVIWAESTFGAGAVDRISRGKWQFVVVPAAAAGTPIDVVGEQRGHSGSPRTEAEPIGRDYRPADETLEIAERDPFSVDPVAVDRANRTHAATQNAVAAFLQTRGIEPRSPAPDEPDADLLWQHGDTVYVAEVKSLSESNVEKQLRLGLGQVLWYRHSLAAHGHHVVAVLVSERPAPAPWQSLCAQLGVILTWPGALDTLTSARPEPTEAPEVPTA